MKQKSKKTIFYCQQCGYESTKWLGQCPACKEWNTFVEEVVDKKSISSSGKINTSVKRETQTYVLNEIKIDEQDRMMTGMKSFMRWGIFGITVWCCWHTIISSRRKCSVSL